MNKSVIVRRPAGAAWNVRHASYNNRPGVVVDTKTSYTGNPQLKVLFTDGVSLWFRTTSVAFVSDVDATGDALQRLRHA